MTRSHAAVSQEHPLGCAVACVASRARLSYARALLLFSDREGAWTRGYFCEEVVQALAAAGLSYGYERFDPGRHSHLLQRDGTLVFISRSARYPAGHYLARLGGRWMNPWSNYPQMVPVEAAFEESLPGGVEYVLFEEKDGRF